MSTTVSVVKHAKKKPATAAAAAKKQKPAPSAKSAATSERSAAEDESDVSKYTKLTDREHILLRPDTYVGSIETVELDTFVIEPGPPVAVVLKPALINLGIYKIVDEILVNARDQHVRMAQAIAGGDATQKPVTKIEVSIQRGGAATDSRCLISVTNDGTGLPVAKHPEHDLWVPEMVFGHLRSGENYNDSQLRTVGGRNGLGAKLAFVFSRWARITTVDHTRQLKYVQIFQDNLGAIDAPVVTKCTTKPFTCIEFEPDLARFGIDPTQGLSDDMISMLHRRVYDLCVVTGKVKVFLQDQLLPVKSLKQYAEMFLSRSVTPATTASAAAGSDAASIPDQEEDTETMSVEEGTDSASTDPTPSGPASNKTPTIIYESDGDRWEYAVARSPMDEYRQMSWVNGVYTRLGGKHVDYILGQITNKVIDLIQKRKKIAVAPATIREQLILFVRCDIDNPVFDSQAKDTLTLPVAKFGSTCNVSAAFVEKVYKLVIDSCLALTEAKQNRQAQRSDGKKTRTIRGIPNLVDANWAGDPAKSAQCILFLTEGLSALSGVVSGLSSADRNIVGIYPLRGKPMNARGETAARVSANREIADIKRVLGLETGRVYTTLAEVHEKLRYGRVVILADSDEDGTHIAALVINLFSSQWASLFRIQGFLGVMKTPILRATRGSTVLSFYTLREYETWREANTATAHLFRIKYYKGLGTSTRTEWQEYFSNKKLMDFAYVGPVDDDTVDKAFNKTRAADRKTWLENYQKDNRLDMAHTVVPYHRFIDCELLSFSVYDCSRSIPCLVDGLKTSLRKVLFCAFKRRLTQEIKVAQMAGYVSEHACYHHGEQSLSGAIKHMAQTFVGAGNNLNLLTPNGQFGSRLAGGTDAASERYIFTQLSPLARLVFPEVDDAVLTFLEDDGTPVEPQFYVPILPMVMVNQSIGIGTGFSCNIPSFNPRDLIRILRGMLTATKTQEESREDINTLVPYYEGFRGRIERVAAPGDDAASTPPKFLVSGTYEKTGEDKITITELPVGTWTLPYMEFLDSLADATAVDKQGKKIPPILRDVQNMSTDSAVCIHLTFVRGKLAELESAGTGVLEKTLRLTTLLSLSNMHLFNADTQLRKFATLWDILTAYYEVRMDAYARRKTAQLAALQKRIVRISNKAAYISANLDGTVDLRRKSAAEVDAMLESVHLVRLAATDDASTTAATLSYKYLTGMPMSSVTAEAVDDLLKEKAALETEFATLQGKTEAALWIEDLDALEKKMDELATKAATAAATTAVASATGTSKPKPASKKQKTPPTAEKADATTPASANKKPKQLKQAQLTF